MRYKFISSKEKIQGTYHPLIRVGRKKKRGVLMKAAIQNKKKRHKFQSKKNIQGTQHPLIRVGRKNKRGVMMKSAIQNTDKSNTSFNLQRKIFKVHTTH